MAKATTKATAKTPSKAKPAAAQSEPLIGAHQSIAGGMYKAVERAVSINSTALQVFTKSSNQWRAKPLTPEDIASYKSAISEANLAPVVAHASYLINMCGADDRILMQSRAAYREELDRCEALGIPYLNFHPGAHMGRGDENGIETIAESLNLVHKQTPGYKTKSVLETTAGQGSAIGHTFEHLKAIIELVDEPARMGVCIDTCHIFAAGYDIRTAETYEATMKAFDKIIGLKRLVAIHINDSKKPFGSHLDRHEHIGKGEIGLSGFRFIMNDPRLAAIPKILETEKEEDLAQDVVNLKTLRKLIGK